MRVTTPEGAELAMCFVYLAIAIIAIMGALIYARFKKGTHSQRLLCNYSIVAVALVLVYAVEAALDVGFTLLPYLYTVCDLGIALSCDRMHMHYISCILSLRQKYGGKRGYVALDTEHRFLSCNNKAYELIPFLKEQLVDEKPPADDALVSKRCYKEPMSYEKAEQIMVEGMGSQFGPGLESVFLACCDKLEAYYKKA